MRFSKKMSRLLTVPNSLACRFGLFVDGDRSKEGRKDGMTAAGPRSDLPVDRFTSGRKDMLWQSDGLSASPLLAERRWPRAKRVRPLLSPR